MTDNKISHTTDLHDGAVADWHNVVGWFADTIRRGLRLVGGFPVLLGKIKGFVEDGLFDRKVDLEDAEVLMNLSESGVTRTLFDTLKAAINSLTVHDSGETRVIERLRLSETQSQVIRRRNTFDAEKCLLNTVATDNDFEDGFARFLQSAEDVAAFYKNSEKTGLMMECQTAGGGIIRDYRPDFVARAIDGTIWIVETKGREDIQDPRKWRRLKLCCEDASGQDAPRRYRPLFVREEDWKPLLNPMRTLAEAWSVFGEDGSSSD
jgi:type III restriction enzyme